MSQRFEYFLVDRFKRQWSCNNAVTVEDAQRIAARDAKANPDCAPFTVWERVITETPLAPGAPETAP